MSRRIHIGDMIRNKLKEDSRSGIWLAEKINCSDSNISKILKKPSMNVDLLLDISLALGKNFFLYYSDIYYDKVQKKQDIPTMDIMMSKLDTIIEIIDGMNISTLEKP